MPKCLVACFCPFEFLIIALLCREFGSLSEDRVNALMWLSDPSHCQLTIICLLY